MTIEELFESEEAINIRQGNFDELSDEYIKNENCYSLSDIAMNLMILVRRLTIEECKKKVEAYIPFYEGNTYYAEIDFDTFPTDLNNIDI